MRRVFEEIAEEARLEWLGGYFRGRLGGEPATWDAVLAVIRAELPGEYARALEAAGRAVPHDDSAAAAAQPRGVGAGGRHAGRHAGRQAGRRRARDAAVVRAEAAAEQHRLEALEHARRIATRRLAYLEARSLAES